MAEVAFRGSSFENLRVIDAESVRGDQVGIGNWVGRMSLVEVEVDWLGLVEIVESLD